MNNRAKIKALQAKIRALQAELVVERCWTERYRNLWLQELAAIHKTAVPQTIKPTESHQPCGERRMPTLDSQHNADRAMLTAAAPAAADFFPAPAAADFFRDAV